MKNLVKTNIIMAVVVSGLISLIGTFTVNKFTPIRYQNIIAYEYNKMDKYRDFVTENFPVTSYDNPTTFIVDLDKKLRNNPKIDGIINSCIILDKMRGIVPFSFSLKDNKIEVEIISESQEDLNKCSMVINRSVVNYNKYIINRYRENYLLNLEFQNSSALKEYSLKLEKELEPKIEKLVNSLGEIINELTFDELNINKRLSVLDNYIDVKQLLNDNFRIFDGKRDLIPIEFLDDLVFIELESENFKTQPKPDNLKILVSIFFTTLLVIYIFRFYMNNTKIFKKAIRNSLS